MILIPSDILAQLPSVIVQEGVISASLNASMVQDVLAGIYTMVYSGAMYFYISRNKPHIRIVASSLTVLYILSMITFIIEWWWLDQWMVINGSTRESMFLSTIVGPAPGVFVFNNFIFYLQFILSNLFLIWRCYEISERNIRAVAVQLGLCVIQSCLLIASMVLSALARVARSENAGLTRQYNNVVSAFVIATLINAVIATIRLGHRSHNEPPPTGTRSGPILHHFMTIIWDSAAIYPFTLLVLAVIGLMPQSYHLGTTELIISYYVQYVVGVVAGMAPTIVMGSIAVKGHVKKKKAAPTKTNHVVSELRFGSAPGTAARSHRETVISIQLGNGPHGGVQAVKTAKSLVAIAEKTEKEFA